MIPTHQRLDCDWITWSHFYKWVVIKPRRAALSISILFKLATNHVAEKNFAVILLLGNFQIAKIDNIYADVILLDSSAYMG